LRHIACYNLLLQSTAVSDPLFLRLKYGEIAVFFFFSSAKTITLERSFGGFASLSIVQCQWSSRRRIHTDNFFGSIGHNLRSPFDQNEGKMQPFQAVKDGTRAKNGPFGILASLANELGCIVEKNEAFLETFPWCNRSQSPFTDGVTRKWLFCLFCRSKR